MTPPGQPRVKVIAAGTGPTAALPEDVDGGKKLAAAALTGLSIRKPVGKGKPSKILLQKYAFPANDAKLEGLAVEYGDDGKVVLATRVDGVERKLACGSGAWVRGRAAWGRLAEQPVAASGAWTADDVYTARVCFTETPFVLTLTVTVRGAEVLVEPAMNVRFGAAKDARLIGKSK